MWKKKFHHTTFVCHQDENSSTRSQTKTEFSRKIFLVGVYSVRDAFTHSHQSIAPRLFFLFIHQFQDYVFNGNLIESNSSLALPNCDPIHIDRYKTFNCRIESSRLVWRSNLLSLDNNKKVVLYTTSLWTATYILWSLLHRSHLLWRYFGFSTTSLTPPSMGLHS